IIGSANSSANEIAEATATHVLLAFHMLIINILVSNLLIAVFTSTNKGMLDVTKIEDLNPTSLMFIEACKKNGLKYFDDYNALEPLSGSVGAVQVSTQNGRR
ncbi:unnamed protein product, partial [Didymodactylos carnosus]